MFFSLLLDENISDSIVNALEQQGYDIYAIRKKARGLSDREIVDLSKKQLRIIVTFDKDFGELVFKNKLHPFGVLLLRMRDHQPQTILRALEKLFKKIDQLNITLEHHYVVFNTRTIRVRSI